jgi:pimeloyl-ACP methyl ester carboxylesterase
MPHVDNNGVRIEYEVLGHGEPLVLIHGWSCEGRYWSEFGYLDKLRDEFTIIVPNLRGHGRSDSPRNRDFSDAAFASDVIAVLDDRGIDTAHVFGYSLGGWVVFELLATNRPRIKTAIVGGAHPYAEDTSMLRGLPARALVSYWEALGAPLSDESKRRIEAFDQQELAEMIPDRIDKSGRLAGFGVRSLMICGTNDDRFEGMRRFAATDEGCCTFVPVRDADHLQAWFRSDEPVSAVRDFLRATIA